MRLGAIGHMFLGCDVEKYLASQSAFSDAEYKYQSCSVIIVTPILRTTELPVRAVSIHYLNYLTYCSATYVASTHQHQILAVRIMLQHSLSLEVFPNHYRYSTTVRL